jgi:hypothetical protein
MLERHLQSVSTVNPLIYQKTVRPVVSLVIEREPEKRGPGRPNGSKNRAVG